MSSAAGVGLAGCVTGSLSARLRMRHVSWSSSIRHRPALVRVERGGTIGVLGAET